MENKSKYKKSNITFIFAIVIVTIIGFFIVFSFLFKNMDQISSVSQDLACKFLVTGKEFSKLGLGVYLYEFKNKCHVDKIIVKNIDKDSTLRPIAESMRRCWYRYNEGKSDFLSNWDSKGEFCFQCSEISFENKDGKIYPYSEFVDWMKNHKFKTKNGKISYANYTSALEVKDINLDLYPKALEKIKNAKIQIGNYDASDDFKKTYLDMQSSSFDILNSYKVKEINPKEKTFVVLKYIRVDKNLIDSLFEMASSFSNIVGTGLGAYTIFRPFKSIGLIKDTTVGIKNIPKSLKNTRILKVGDIVSYKRGSKMIEHKITKIFSDGTYQLKSSKGNVFKLGIKKSKLLKKSFGKFSNLKLTKAVAKKTLKFFRKNPVIAALIIGTSFLVSNTDKNYIQYTEVLNQEQYYRTCGTQRYPNK